jgi:hypothetical protein
MTSETCENAPISEATLGATVRVPKDLDHAAMTKYVHGSSLDFRAI